MQEKKKIKISDPKQALSKAETYCAYQERCHQEVRDKLYEWGMWPEAVENIISELINSGYINEERFAKLFAGGKFRIKKWGRIKIRSELKKRKIVDYCIKKALQEIDEAQYFKTLKEILDRKSKEIKEKNPVIKNNKVARYAISRGFEADLVRDLMKND